MFLFSVACLSAVCAVVSVRCGLAMMEVDPPEATFFPLEAESKSMHNLINGTDSRLAVKMKCSNNDLYRMDPVYALLAPSASQLLRIVRQPGPVPSNADRVVIEHVQAPAEALIGDAAILFREPTAHIRELTLPLVPTDQPPVYDAAENDHDDDDDDDDDD